MDKVCQRCLARSVSRGRKRSVGQSESDEPKLVFLIAVGFDLFSVVNKMSVPVISK